MRALIVVAAAIVAFSSTASRAEMVPVEDIGGWQLMRDADPIFGDLGYRLTLRDTGSTGASTLSLICTFEEERTVSYSIQLTSPELTLPAANGRQVSGLLRFGDDEIRDSEWIVSGDSLSYSSGGANYLAGINDAGFEAAVRAGNAGEGGHLGRMLAIGRLANGIQAFFWKATVSSQLALGFGSGGNRRSLLFNLDDGATAIDRLLAACHDAADARLPEDTVSPREAAPWRSLDTTRGEFKTVSLEVNQCLELHPVRHRRGDPLTVVDSENPATRLTAAVGDADLLIEGPKKRLQIYFGESASAGRFQYRTWDKQAATCDQD